MTTAERFEDLQVWQTAKELTSLIHLSSFGTFAGDFGPRDQMRRAAVSIMSNITKGFESQTQAMFIQFPGRAKGCAGEFRAQRYIAQEQEYITNDEFHSLMSLAAQQEACPFYSVPGVPAPRPSRTGGSSAI
ncbi:MAG: four helix bundle protein [Bacteroidota bacterium]